MNCIKKNYFLLILIFICIFLFSCESSVESEGTFREELIILEDNYVDFITQEQYVKNGHLALLPEFNTDATIAYLNKDGTATLYAFAVPIRFINEKNEYVNIDTRIINVADDEYRKKGYIYKIALSDIEPYYPKCFSNGMLIKGETSYIVKSLVKNSLPAKYIKKKNIINEEKNMIHYGKVFGEGTSLDLYPTLLGSAAEIELLEKNDASLSFSLTLDDGFIDINEFGYLVINKKVAKETGELENKIIGVIQTPIIKDKDGKISCYNKWSYKLLNNEYVITLEPDIDFLNTTSYPIKIYTTFEQRRFKQPDSAIFSKKPNLNTFLSHISIVGNNHLYGIARNRIRFNFAKYLGRNSEKIFSAHYNVYCINNCKNCKLELLTLNEDWCSITGTWNTEVAIGERTSISEIYDQVVSFDITDETKKWNGDTTGVLEHNGVLMKYINEECDIFSILSSNDSTLFNNYAEIILK